MIMAGLFIMCLTPVFADDAADLKKLEPLSSLEQPMYEKVKDNTAELHKFITTRAYVRAAWQFIKEQHLNPEKLGADLARFPSVPEGVDMSYAANFADQLLLYNIMLYQGIDSGTL